MPSSAPDALPISPPAGRTVVGRLAACAAVVLAFAGPAAAVIALGVNRGPQFDDEQNYHLPTVRRFADQWPAGRRPAFDFRSYPAAMTPGYHLMMAGVARAGGGRTALRAATLLLTAGFLATLAWWVSGRVPPADAALLCLPLAWSQYVFASGAYAVPHNLGWWGVLTVLLLALRPAFDRVTVPAGAVLLWAVVMARQVHAWAVLPLLTAAWAGGRPAAGDRSAADGERHDRANVQNRSVGRRLARVGLVATATLPAAASLGYFVWLWGGPVPVIEQPWVRPTSGLNLPALAMMCATAGFAGAFFVPSFARSLPPGRWRWAAAGGLLAAGVAAAAATDYDEPAGRWGGLWQLARVTPTFGSQNPAVILLAAAGGAAVGAALAAVGRRDRLVLAAAGVGFAAAHAAVNQAWQRYYEPMVLMLFVVCAAAAIQAATGVMPGRGTAGTVATGAGSLALLTAAPERGANRPRARVIGRVGLAVLACVQAALTAHSLGAFR